MDEPTSALDPISTSRIEDLAMELKVQYTIVIVTHNMQQAVRISDQTAFFSLAIWWSTVIRRKCSPSPRTSVRKLTSPAGLVNCRPTELSKGSVYNL